MDDKLINGIEDVMAHFCQEICKEPLLFFSEYDLQSILYEKLLRIQKLKKLYPTSVNRGNKSKNKYKTLLIHKEYGIGDKERIDLSIFNPNDVGKINGTNLMINRKYIIPDITIELGTEKSRNIENHANVDYLKLLSSNEKSYLLHFHRDHTFAKTGSPKREGKDKNLDIKVKSPFSELYKNNTNPKIKIIAFIIGIVRDQKRIWGRCEIFKNGEWEKINADKIKNQVLELLK